MSGEDSQRRDLPSKLPPIRRIARGRLEGDLSGFGPCLVLGRMGAQDGRWREGEGRDGLFVFGQPTEDGTNLFVRSGLILPLALCRDSKLASKLQAFAAVTRASAAPSSQRRGTDRRYTLQEWLRFEGLRILRLVDWDVARTWLRFSLNKEVFCDLLSCFDYVTAMADETGQVSQVLEHAPFTWTSQGSLLDWAMEKDDVFAVSPFSLYLVTDLHSLKKPLRSSCDGDDLFHPAAYWAGVMRPDEEVGSEPVLVQLTQRAYGWIDLEITLGNTTARITLSDEFDPLPGLMDWLMAVRDGDLPIGLTINEEGEYAKLIAHAFGRDRLLVTVFEDLTGHVRAVAVVERDSLIAAFRSELAASWARSSPSDTGDHTERSAMQRAQGPISMTSSPTLSWREARAAHRRAGLAQHRRTASCSRNRECISALTRKGPELGQAFKLSLRAI